MNHRLRTGLLSKLADWRCCCHVVFSALAQAAGAQANLRPHAEVAHADVAKEKWAFLDQYCSKCHNTTDWAGGIAFDSLTADNIPDDAETWEKAVRKLRGRLMPPAGNPQPDNQAVASFVSWMETNLDNAAAGHDDPGRVALHRLNRKEYANAVRDLLAVEIDPVDVLPPDDAKDGFDNVADALQVSPSFLDQYLAAARTVAVKALGNRDARPVGTTYTSGGGEQFFRRRRSAARHSRRHRRDARLPGGWRVRHQHRRTWPRRSGSTTWSSRTRWS